MAKDRPPKPTLTASPVLSVVEQRKLMFNAWIDECTAMQEAFIEGLLALMPSLDNRGG